VCKYYTRRRIQAKAIKTETSKKREKLYVQKILALCVNVYDRKAIKLSVDKIFSRVGAFGFVKHIKQNKLIFSNK